MILFLDTNVFLHYRKLAEIDWLKLTNEIAVTLAFSPVTLRELNEKKDGAGSHRNKKRAQSAIADIDLLFSAGLNAMIKPGVAAECIPFDPSIDFAGNRLRTDLNDDWLIATALERKAALPAGERCAILTADTGLKLKCMAHGVAVVRPLDADKLPEEDDFDAKKIKSLEREILILKSAAPTLSLTFAGDQTVAKIKLKPQANFDEAAATQKLNAEKAKVVKLPPEPGSSDFKSKTGAPPGYQISGFEKGEIDLFNSTVDLYLSNFVQGLRRQHDYENLVKRSFLIEIALSNTGTAPAEEISVHLHFPNGFTLYSEKDFPRRPEIMAPPKKPLTLIQKLHVGLDLGPQLVPEIRHPIISGIGGNLGALSIKRTRSYDVDQKVKKLNHGFTEPLDVMAACLNDPTKALSFHIDYEIHAANLPSPAKGQLHMVIEHQ